MHRHIRIAIAIACLAGCAHHVAAQATLVSPKQDLRDLGGDFWKTWTSPIHPNRNDLPGIAISLGMVGATAFIDRPVWAWARNNPQALVMRGLGPIREGWKLPAYEFGSGQYILPMSALLYTAGRLSHKPGLRDAGLGCAATHLTSAAYRFPVYGLIARSRPQVTDNPFDISIPGSKKWNRQSFASGHEANSMACASFLGHRFSLGAFEPVPYIYSGLIGVGRIVDGRHWTSDTMAGALIGFAIGKAVAERQLSRSSVREASGVALLKAPVTVGWSFAF